MRNSFKVQYTGNEVDFSHLVEASKEIWKSDGNKIKDLLTLDLYYKPEENRCYYVFNGKGSDNSYFEV